MGLALLGQSGEGLIQSGALLLNRLEGLRGVLQLAVRASEVLDLGSDLLFLLLQESESFIRSLQFGLAVGDGMLKFAIASGELFLLIGGLGAQGFELLPLLLHLLVEALLLVRLPLELFLKCLELGSVAALVFGESLDVAFVLSALRHEGGQGGAEFGVPGL